MAKQTFTTGQVLTAAQMTSLQQTAMLGGAASAKTASYTLVAADAGTAISMSSASATTITVNTGLFAAGDTVQITNLGAGVCTITAGTATVNSSASLALAQYESGTLDFTTSSAAIFIKGAAGGGASGKVLQVVQGTSATQANSTSATFADTGLTVNITPSSVSSKVLAICYFGQNNTSGRGSFRLVRDSTTILGQWELQAQYASVMSLLYLDSPSTTSSTTYKVQFNRYSGTQEFAPDNSTAVIVVLEIGA